MSLVFDTESDLAAAAAKAALSWRDAGIQMLMVGLSGALGVGKTCFVRAMLRGLGYAGRVPSPTYTLVEPYEIGALNVIHLDLYRLSAPRDLDFLGLTDYLARQAVWVLAEWPERGGDFANSLDLMLELTIGREDVRVLSVSAPTAVGRRAARLWLGPDFN